jgi:Domain of unknown function (DUF6265)
MIKYQFATAFFILSIHAFSQPALQSVFWLNGEWKRTNASPGRSAYETWTTVGDEMIGRGVTLRGNDTVFVEKIKIISKSDGLYYAADVPENNGVVLFKFIRLNATGFICENQTHDFPKQIEYRLEGEKLKATISGNGKTIDYWFTRAK